MSEFLRITLNVDGVTVVDRLLQGIEERAHDMTPVWPAVYDAFKAIVAKAFDTEGASTDAGKWADLAPSTQKDRARHGFPRSHPILQRTGALKRALTLGVGAYARMTPTSFQVQLASEPESIASFGAHQRGVPSRKLPRRAMVSFTADQRTQLVFPIRLYLTGRDLNAPRRAPIA
jgi:hypothetical protein